MKLSRLKIYIGVIWLLVYLHDENSIVDCTSNADECVSELGKLTDDQTDCLRSFYTSFEDLCQYQPSLYTEGKSFCMKTWLDEGLECTSNPQCLCHTLHMNCNALKMTSFPQRIDQEITWLHLRNNYLGNDVTKMPFVNYIQLLYLDLSHNPLYQLEPFTFQYLKKLTMLTLKSAEIVVIKVDAFYGLTNLKVLDLSDNKLTILTAKMFEKLTTLNVLNLRVNAIETIESSTFNDLTSLNILDLENNHLKSLSSDTIPALHHLKILYAQNNQIETVQFDTNGPFRLQKLDLRGNILFQLTPDMFKMLSELIILNLRSNKITTLADSTFSFLTRLKELNLKHNNITQLTSKMLQDIVLLEILDLSGNNIETIQSYAFKNLSNLLTLDLHKNKITRLYDETFCGLTRLSHLNLQNNQIRKAGRSVFKVMPNLQHLHTDEFRFCCLAKRVPHCLPPPDEFCSCHDLMTNIVLRICIWTLGIIAVISNTFVIIFRTVNKNVNQIHSFFIKNLALSDLLMGIYLLTIASADLHYRGAYGFYELDWRTSKVCNFAGFLSTFSSELTVFTLTVITVHRYFSIANPFCIHRLEMKRARLLMLTGWIFALFIALIPLPIFRINYFNHFYGRSGVCLPLHITKDKFNGWEYSVSVFIVLNTISFAIITTCYISIYGIANKTRPNVQIRGENREQQKKMAFRMTLLVSADAACWMPIIALGLRSLAGFGSVSSNLYAWIAVFILPLNAALNPILYTLSLIPLRKMNWKWGNVNQYLKFWNRSTAPVSSNDT